jgi:hypothetical protein
VNRHFLITALALSSCSGSSNSVQAPDPTQGPTFQSDDFNSCAGLRSHWQVVNPLGDSTLEVIGAGTDAAQLSIDVPGGVPHDVDGTNLAPRVMQLTPDGDLELEVSFGSQPSLAGQFQGLLVQQDSTNWISFDFVGGDTGMRVTANETTAGVTTLLFSQELSTPSSSGELFMRARRTDDVWTQHYSTDGFSWQLAADFRTGQTITSIGVTAGNGGDDPQAFTALCD